MAILFKLFGVIGLLFITRGTFVKNEKIRDWHLAAGGLCLLTYSIYLRDPIFIPLEAIFFLSIMYREYQLHKNK